jgi:hypothetical protein
MSATGLQCGCRLKSATFAPFRVGRCFGPRQSSRTPTLAPGRGKDAPQSPELGPSTDVPRLKLTHPVLAPSAVAAGHILGAQIRVAPFPHDLKYGRFRHSRKLHEQDADAVESFRIRDILLMSKTQLDRIPQSLNLCVLVIRSDIVKHHDAAFANEG